MSKYYVYYISVVATIAIVTPLIKNFHLTRGIHTNAAIEISGVSHTVQQWPKRINLSQSGFRQRMRRGMGVETALAKSRMR